MPDVMESFQASQGQNGRVDPMLLGNGYASRLYNASVRDGLISTRPGLSGEEFPAQGVFQGAFEYRLEGSPYLIAVVSGQVWQRRVPGGQWAPRAAFPTTDFDQAYFVQADQYVIIQNGISDPVENWPIIIRKEEVIDNLSTQYMSGNDLVAVKDFTGNAGGPSTIRVPIGRAMAYGHGRLFVAVDRYYDDGAASRLPQGWKTNLGFRFWQAGDVAQPGNVEALLVFSAGYNLAEGLAFNLPVEMGFITSMAFLRNAETGSGLGALIIFARRGAAAFAVNITRKSWLAPGFGQVLFTSSGTNSPWSVAPVNSDLVYYGDYGLRTLKYSATLEAGSAGLAVTSVSPEVSNFTDFTDEEAHAPFVTVASADNYIFFTAGGVTLPDGSVAFRAVLPWDLVTFQISGQAPARVFAGAWCGALYHAVVPFRAASGQPAVFYRESASGKLMFGVFDGKAVEPARTVAVHTQAFAFSAPLRRKKLKHVTVMFDGVVGNLAAWVRWRTDGSRDWKITGVRRFTGTGGATGVVRIPVESDEATGFVFQFSVEWRGHARLQLALFTAAVLDGFDGDEDMCGVVDLKGEEHGADHEFMCPTLGEPS